MNGDQTHVSQNDGGSPEVGGGLAEVLSLKASSVNILHLHLFPIL